ncbi:MAG: Cycloserine biosynthesis protein DcsG [Planctomycetota bacterium]
MIPSTMRRIGIVTCGAEKLADYFPTAAEPDFVPTEPPFTPDDQVLVDELRRRGHQVSAVVWGVEPWQLIGQFDRLILRSAWDYMDSDELRQGFLRWLEQLAATGMQVDNEPPVMLWLMDKRYLLDFAAVGVPIVPTYWIPRGESLDLGMFFEQHGATVIKPAVSAAGAGLEFLPDRQAALAFQQEFTDRCRRGAQLVQTFLPEIQSHGEWSLVYFRGEYSHAAHKLPARGQIMVHAERGGSLRFADPPSVVRQSGDRAAAAVSHAFAQREGRPCRMPLYLRIDIIETAIGALLSECEGVEPELFFRARVGSAARCADKIESD